MYKSRKRKKTLESNWPNIEKFYNFVSSSLSIVSYIPFSLSWSRAILAFGTLAIYMKGQIAGVFKYSLFQFPLRVVPYGLVVRIRRSHRRGPGSIPGVGNGRFFPLYFEVRFPLCLVILSNSSMTVKAVFNAFFVYLFTKLPTKQKRVNYYFNLIINYLIIYFLLVIIIILDPG